MYLENGEVRLFLTKNPRPLVWLRSAFMGNLHQLFHKKIYPPRECICEAAKIRPMSKEFTPWLRLIEASSILHAKKIATLATIMRQ
jgi:hypothetical protein